ncbi:MAG: DEAD/DEAH box helicase [Prevotella sp.]|nr:DEAD/DEAH box helicase [Prevotella sp.]
MDVRTILDKIGVENLNAMQEEAMDAVLHSDQDLVVLSPTGSGKTLAYLLPMIQRLDPQTSKVQAVILVPGRELALQSATVLKDMRTGIRSLSLYGGRPTMDEHRMLKEVMPQVVFATPGRLNDHLNKGNFDVDQVKWLVIDEFDKCLAMGFQDEMSEVVSQLPSVKRRILLSATDAEEIPQFVSLGRTRRINYLDETEQVSSRVIIYKVKSPDKDKLETVSKLLRSVGEESSVVFLNYRESVERTADYLRHQGFTISMFHGGLDQKLREDALYRFSNGSANVLVCTDLASRGLDIPDIENIIHYHLPETEDGYVHRVGRTARWDKTGKTFFVLGPGENVPGYVKGDQDLYELPQQLPPPALPKMTTLYIGKGKKDKISKGDIVGFLCKKGGLQPDEIGRIDVKERYSYVAIARQRLSIVLKLSRGEKIKGVKTIVEAVK